MAITSLYPYDPNRVLPIVFGVIVLILGIVILFQSLRRRWWYFAFFMTWASAVWVTGFIMREISIFNTLNVGLFIAQYLLIFAGPTIFATSETFILGRLLAYLPYHAPIHPGRIMYVFVWLGAAVEALAISGATTSSNPQASAAARASALARVKASLILQEFVELFFFSFVAVVEYRCRKAGRLPHNVKTICRVLYVTSLMMMARCIVRTVEGFELSSCDPSAPGYTGYCGSVDSYEWYLWVFEVANITVFIAALAIWHPSRFLPSNDKIYLDPHDGVTERVGPGFTVAQNRSTLSTYLDPLDFEGMVKGKETDKFWERDNEISQGRNFAGEKRNKESSQHTWFPFGHR